MKKIFFISALTILAFFITSCSGYKPIFGSSNIKFEIIDFEIEGDSEIGNRIYSKFKNLSKQNKQEENSREIRILINVTKSKNATTKNSAGKILGYKVSLSTTIIVKDLMTGNEILNIKNQFRKAALSKFFNQVEFQYSNVRFADKYKNHIKNSKNIILALNTQLSHFVGENNSAKYALCVSGNKKKKIKAKYFVLACGGIENSRLLLWTKVKNSGFFNKNLPIGKYWMTHPHVLGARGVISRKKLNMKTLFLIEMLIFN